MRTFLFLGALFSAQVIFGQPLTGSKSIPEDYASIEAAIVALNSEGVGDGGVIFNVDAGHLETFSTPAAGLITTLFSSAANPIVFQKSGTGDNPLITAATPGTTTDRDFVICIAGTDYVTFDGIDILENPSNADPTQQMEWGYALVKASSTAPFNGCQHVVIRNCNISLNRSNPNSVGIYSGCHTSSSLDAITLASATDATSYCKFYGNHLTNVNSGISLNGNWTTNPDLLFDQYNEIGKDGADSIFDFGSGAAVYAYGVNVSYQKGITIANQNIHGTAMSSTGVYGISSGSASSNIYDNNISLLVSGGSYYNGYFSGILCTDNYEITDGNTTYINNNNVSGCRYYNANDGFMGIKYDGNAKILDCTGNEVTGNFYGATSNWGYASFYGINAFANSSTPGSTWNINNNLVSGNQRIQTSPFTGTNTYIGCYGSWENTINVSNNIVENNTSENGRETYGIYLSLAGPDSYCNGNKVANITNTSAEGRLTGIYQAGGTNSEINGNRIYGLNSDFSMDYTFMYGMYVEYGLKTRISNNFISGLNAPLATGIDAINGLYVDGIREVGIYFNTIYLDADSSSATTFGSSALHAYTNPFVTIMPMIDIRNNIFVNISDHVPAGGDAYTVAFRRTGNLSVYALSSGFNDFYAGEPGPNNLIFYDGTSSDQTLPDFQARVMPRDAFSITENPPFLDALNNDLHLDPAIGTQCESGGLALTVPFSITTDWDNEPRGSFPDIGADEFTGIMIDLFPPVIDYVPLVNTTSILPRTLITTIKDPSGLPETGGGLPTLYWKINGEDSTGVQGIPAAGNEFSFTFGADVFLGDVISYYIVAQDNASTPNVGSLPLGGSGFSADPPSCFVPPAMPHSYTIVPAIAGLVSVGDGGTYPSLTGADGLFHAINNGVLTGKLIASVISDLSEDGTHPLKQWLEEPEGSDFNLTIQPDGTTERLISGNVQQGMIRFDGADRVTVDGRSGGAGRYLRFRNTNEYDPASTFLFVNDATGNTLRNCFIEGSSNGFYSFTSGVVHFSTSTGTIGNDNNTVTECILRDRSDQDVHPYTMIYSMGSRWKENSSITISNNYIMNFLYAGIYVGEDGSGENWNITGNSIFSTISNTIEYNWLYGIYFRGTNTNATGCNISGNYVGGQAAYCSGPPWTNHTNLYSFGAIFIEINNNYGFSGAIDMSVQNNTVQNINLTNSGNVMFRGINAWSGNQADFTITGNTIGHNSAPGSITLAGTGSIYMLASFSNGGTMILQDNTVANINFTSSSQPVLNPLVYAGSQYMTVKGNQIHDCSAVNSSYLQGLSIMAQNGFGQIEGNSVYNLTVNGPSDSYATVLGMSLSNNSGNIGFSVTKNRIYNLVNLNSGAQASLTGIELYTADCALSNNVISLGENTGNQVSVRGIDFNGSLRNHIDHNSVYISGAATSGTNNSYCFNNNGWTYSSAFLKDNIFVNTRTGPGKHYAISSTNTSPGVLMSNYNDLFTTAAPLARWGNTDKADLAAWRSASGQDLNSISVDPSFISATYLMPTNSSMGKSGIYLPSVPVDYTGALRSDPPDQGAYEFTEVPIVTTDPASDIASHSASMNGTIDANDLAVESWFDYGLTDAYGESVAGIPDAISGSDPTAFSANITGLQAATTYHFRARGVSTTGKTGYGEDLTFTTADCLPSFTEGCAEGDGLTHLQLNTIDLDIPCSGTPEWYHDFTDVSTELLIGTPYTLTFMAGHSDTHVTLWIDINDNNIFESTEIILSDFTCLDASVDYTIAYAFPYGTPPGPHRLRLMANSEVAATDPCGEYNYGNAADFSVMLIMISPPTVVTNAATDITKNSATINGSVNANRSLTSVTFEYGTSTYYGYSIAGIPGTVSGNSATDVSSALSGLYAATTYHYRIVGINSLGTSYGSDMTFTTSPGPPVASTDPATQIQPTSATLNGIAFAGGALTTLSFEYGTSTDYGTTVSGNPSSIDGNYPVNAYASIVDLDPNMTYHYRINASNVYGTCNGGDMTFTTPLTCLPNYVYGCYYYGIDMGLTLFQLNTISQNIACDGVPNTYYHDFTYISSDLVTNIPYTLTVQAAFDQTHVAVWIDFNDNDLFESSEKVVADLNCTAMGNDFTATLIIPSEAAPGTHKMRFRTNYANIVPDPCSTLDYGNGADFSVNVSAGTNPPTSVTLAATDIGYHTATLNGTVNANETSASVIFEYGLTTSYGTTVSGIPGAVTGNTVTAVNAAVTGLLDNATYHYRIVGYNSTGGASGDDMSFTTPEEPCLPVYYTGCENYGIGLTLFQLNTINQPIACDAYYHDFTSNSTDLVTGIPYTLTVQSGSPYVTYVAVWIDFSDNNIFEDSEKVIADLICTDPYNLFTAYAIIPPEAAPGIHKMRFRSNYYAVVQDPCSALYYGNGADFSVNVVNPLPDPAGSIAGPAEFCAESIGMVYSVPVIANATSYAWNLPPEMTISSGDGTNEITVDVDSTAFIGFITVRGVNDQGTGEVSAFFEVTSVLPPPQHGPISGNKSVCEGAMGEVYSIDPVPYAEGYIWAVPPGAEIVSGENTNSITVNFSTSGGIISVYATNFCGNSSSTPAVNISVWPIPDAPVITYNSKKNKLTSNQGNGNQWYVDNNLIPGATGKNYTPVQPGTYTDIVTEHGCRSAPSNAIYINPGLKFVPVFTPGEEEMLTELIVYPNPNQGNINYKITLPKEETLTIEIFSSIGASVYKQDNIKVDGKSEGNINLESLNDGIYIMCLRGVRTFLTRKIIISN